MKNIHEYLKSDSKASSMRLMSIRSVNTAIVIGLTIALGAVSGLILGIVLDKDLTMIASCIGALTGLGTGLVGAFLLPSFAGKAAQAKFENNNNNNNKEGD